jgi:hypothetical protein
MRAFAIGVTDDVGAELETEGARESDHFGGEERMLTRAVDYDHASMKRAASSRKRG